MPLVLRIDHPFVFIFQRVKNTLIHGIRGIVDYENRNGIICYIFSIKENTLEQQEGNKTTMVVQ